MLSYDSFESPAPSKAPSKALPPDTLFTNPALRMLVAHRAFLVHGHPEPVAPVAADATLARMLWRYHAPLFLPPRLA